MVDKPAGVVVHPARGNWTGTLSQALEGVAAGGEEPWRAGIVHRLDRDTSGLLVVAKNDEVHRALKALLARRLLRREYGALVDGHPSARTGTIDAPIGRDRRERALMSIDTDTPRAARTHFEIERLLPKAALLRVILETGRTHQIRVHLAAIGHPVCGDRQYGVAGRYGLERQFLHAQRLTFEHPVTGVTVDVSSRAAGRPAGGAGAGRTRGVTRMEVDEHAGRSAQRGERPTRSVRATLWGVSRAERGSCPTRALANDERVGFRTDSGPGATRGPRLLDNVRDRATKVDGAARPQPPRRWSANRATGGRGREVRSAGGDIAEGREGRYSPLQHTNVVVSGDLRKLFQ